MVSGSLPEGDGFIGDLSQHASMGVIRMLTPKMAPTPAKAAAMPASGMTAPAQEGGGAERDQDQIAGIRGDAGEHANKDQDEGDHLRGRPRPICGSKHPSARLLRRHPRPPKRRK